MGAILYKNIWFILSVSFQLVGTLAVLIYSLSPTRKSIVNAFFRNSFSAKEDECIIYDHELFLKYYHERIAKLISFIFLLVGFVLQIFACEIAEEPLIISCGVILCSVVLFLILHIISRLVVRRFGTPKVTSRELKEYSIETNIEDIPEKDIYDMFKDR